MTKFAKQSSIPGSAAALRRDLWDSVMKLNQIDHIVDRFISIHRPLGTEPKQLAVDYLNKTCDQLYPDRGPHNYNLDDCSKWRRDVQPVPARVLAVMQSEVLQYITQDVSEDYATHLAKSLGLPQF